MKKEDFELTNEDIEMAEKILKATFVNRGELDAAMGSVETHMDKMSAEIENAKPIKYTLVQIQGATFDLTVNVPDAQFDDILTKIEGFYDRMIKKCRYQEAIEEETGDVMVG